MVELAALIRGVRLARSEPLASVARFLEVGVVAFIGDAVPGRDPTTGGCGKELTLMVLRIVFSGRFDFPSAELDRTVDTLGVDKDCKVFDRADGRGVDGARSLGRDGESLPIFEGSVSTGRLFLGGFTVGIGGRAEVGGSIAGRDSKGSVVATVAILLQGSFSGNAAIERPTGLNLCR